MIYFDLKKAQFVGIDAHIDPRSEETNQGFTLEGKPAHERLRE